MKSTWCSAHPYKAEAGIAKSSFVSEEASSQEEE